jgi:hypothetical protein
MSVNPFAQRMRKAKQILCPFCEEGVPAPGRVMTVFTPDGCLAERCSCGAVYAVDETGRLGGQALLDIQVGASRFNRTSPSARAWFVRRRVETG